MSIKPYDLLQIFTDRQEDRGSFKFREFNQEDPGYDRLEEFTLDYQEDPARLRQVSRAHVRLSRRSRLRQVPRYESAFAMSTTRNRCLVTQDGELGMMRDREFTSYTNFSMEIAHAVQSSPVEAVPTYGFVFSIKTSGTAGVEK